MRMLTSRPLLQLFVLLLLAGLGMGCAKPDDDPAPTTQAAQAPTSTSPGPAWFEDVANSSGLEFDHQWGHEQAFWMPEIMTGGGALFDMDADGDLDAYLVQSGFLLPQDREQPTNRLFRNRGDGTFDDVTAAGGDAAHPGYGMGVATGDVDGDGRIDLYLTNVGPDTLLRNLGDGRFEDVTRQSGLGDPRWGAGAVFFDFDRDGDLDLFVANYLDWSTSREIDCYNNNGRRVFCSPQSYAAPVTDILYRNDGDGTFSDISADSGIDQRPGTGLGALSADFNGDGWSDLFVANDGMPDHLWLNQGDGTFLEDGAFAGCALDQDGKPKAGMGVTVGDLDHDGDPDLMVCNLRQESDSVFRNDGGLFSDITVQQGLATISEPFTRFGMGWQDFDNDGHLDLYQANGRVTRHGIAYVDHDPYAEPDLLFQGTVDGFREVVPRDGTAEPSFATGRAAAFGDIDNDGGVDILVANNHGPAYLLRNIVPQRGHWIAFRVLDRHGAPALGARLSARVGSRQLAAEVRTSSSYLAASDPRLHFGIAEATEVRDVEVRWSDGSTSPFGTFTADQVVTLRQDG